MIQSKFSKAQHVLRARLLWNDMNDNERFGCRFGLFPTKLMTEAESEGYDGRLLVHELMHKACSHD